MPSKEKQSRQDVTIGFNGGGALALKLIEKDATALLAALGKDGWHELQDVDGSVRVDLSQVVYVRTESTEHTVGFGLS